MESLLKELIGEVKGLRADIRALTGAVLNAEEAAIFLGISKRMLSDLALGGSIPRVRLSDGHYGHRRAELEAYAESRLDRRRTAEEWAN